VATSRAEAAVRRTLATCVASVTAGTSHREVEAARSAYGSPRAAVKQRRAPRDLAIK
jgi:hypothetical protein